ncbi:MAG: hypothetical protein WB424_10910 [Terracidiphilus sp.]
MSEPLRPQTLGEILDRSVQLYRARFLVFLGISMAPAAAALAVSFVVGFFAAWWSWSGARSYSVEIGYAIIGLFSLAITLLALPLLLGSGALSEAAISHAVSRVYLGERDEKISIRGAYKSTWRRGWRSVGLFTLQILLIGVAPVIAWTLLAVLATAVETAAKAGPEASDVSTAIAVVMLTLMGLFAVYVTWMLVQLSMAFPACVVEQIGAGRAIKRSWRLANGTKGRIFLLYLLATVLGWVLLLSLEFTLAIVLDLIPATHSGRHGSPFGSILGWGFLIFAVLLQMLIKPILGIAQVLFYYDQRIRQEGFDIEWMMLRAGMTPATVPQREVTISPTVVSHNSANSELNENALHSDGEIK